MGPIVVTPANGHHYWARNDDRLPPLRLDFGEVRTGNGHYVILPGSGFPADYSKNGKRVFKHYAWDKTCAPLHKWEGELPRLPEPLLDRILSVLQQRKKASPKPSKGKLIEGERNAELYKIGSALRGRGLGKPEIIEALLKQNAETCDPPLPEQEVLRIAGSAASYEPNRQPGVRRQLHYVRLFDDFLDDPAVRSLTSRGFRTTVELLKSYRGGDDYDLTLSYGHSPMARHTTNKGLKDVQESGIYYKVQQGRAQDGKNIVSKYRLTPKYFKMARLGQKGPFLVSNGKISSAYACTQPVHTPAPEEPQNGEKSGNNKAGAECIRLHPYIEYLPVYSVGSGKKSVRYGQARHFFDHPLLPAVFARAEGCVQSALPHILFSTPTIRAMKNAVVNSGRNPN